MDKYWNIEKDGKQFSKEQWQLKITTYEEFEPLDLVRKLEGIFKDEKKGRERKGFKTIESNSVKSCELSKSDGSYEYNYYLSLLKVAEYYRIKEEILFNHDYIKSNSNKTSMNLRRDWDYFDVFLSNPYFREGHLLGEVLEEFLERRVHKMPFSIAGNIKNAIPESWHTYIELIDDYPIIPIYGFRCSEG